MGVASAGKFRIKTGAILAAAAGKKNQIIFRSGGMGEPLHCTTLIFSHLTLQKLARLVAPELGIQTFLFNKFFVRAVLDDFALFKNDDAV